MKHAFFGKWMNALTLGTPNVFYVDKELLLTDLWYRWCLHFTLAETIIYRDYSCAQRLISGRTRTLLFIPLGGNTTGQHHHHHLLAQQWRLKREWARKPTNKEGTSRGFTASQTPIIGFPRIFSCATHLLWGQRPREEGKQHADYEHKLGCRSDRFELEPVCCVNCGTSTNHYTSKNLSFFSKITTSD